MTTMTSPATDAPASRAEKRAARLPARPTSSPTPEQTVVPAPTAQVPVRTLTVLIPAHNEGTRTNAHGEVTAPIAETFEGLARQTVRPSRVVVLADNCTDDTASLATAAGAEVFRTVGNTDKKAGALNQWLDENLFGLAEDDLILVMDADSVLDDVFIESAMSYVDRGHHAVGGVFLGKEGGGFVGTLQRNEYARYARDVARKKGRTLVLTGTATVFTAHCLRDVVAARGSGVIPSTGAVSHVYDTKALTEDNELTFALLHLGYDIIAPPECKLRTEVMETWHDLRAQRYRWKRGAIENNSHYGFTRHTAKYLFLQWWGALGILVTALYLTSIVIAIASGSFHFIAFWLFVTVIYVIERIVTVSSRGWKQMLLAATLVVEMPYDITLQFVQAKAFFAALFRAKKNW